MAGALSIQCPHCQATLKLKNRKAIGKKVPCPKCKQPFVVKPLPEPDAEDDFLGDVDSFDDDYGAPEEAYGETARPPVSGPRSTSKKSKKKSSAKRSKSSGWQNPALMAGGGLLCVGLLVGVVWMAVAAFSGSGRDDRLDLAYLPPDSELIVSIRIADIWKAPIVKSLIDKPEVQKNIAEVRKKIGLGPADIQSVIIGVSGLSERQKESAQQNMMQAGGANVPFPGFDDVPGIIVVRTSKAIDKLKLVEYAEKAEEIPAEKIQTVSHDGETYYRIPNSKAGGPEFLAAFFPDDTTIVFGPEKDVKRAIERGSTAQPRPDLDFIDLDQHFLLAMVPKDLSAFAKQNSISRRNSSQSQQKLQQTMKEAVQGFSFGLTLTEGIDFQFQFDCMDSTRAGQFKTDLQVVLDESLAEGRQRMAEAKTALQQLADTEPASSPVWGELIELAETVIDSIEADQQSTTVVVTAAVPGSAGSTLGKIPQAISDAWSQGPFGVPHVGGNVTISKQTSIATNFTTDQPPTVLTETPKPTPLKSVSLEQYQAAWQVDLNVQNEPAGEVLKKLAGELGLTLQTTTARNTALAKPVTVTLAQKSRLEAIEDVCRQIGLSPEYSPMTDGSKPATLSLKPEPRSWPATFAGPFLVEVTAVRENAPYPTGQLELQFYAPGLPPDVLRVVRESRRLVTFEEITDSQERDLTDTGGGSGSSGSSQKTSPIYERTYYVPLKNLLRSVTAIKTVRGKIEFRLPTKIETVRFDKLTVGMSRKIGDIELKIRRANIRPNYSSLSFDVTGAPAGFQYGDVKFEFADAQGHMMRGSGGGASGFGDKWRISADVEGQPASVTAKFITQIEELNYEFRLADVPLKSYAKMPVKIEPAKFAGHEAPVTLQFVKIVPNPDFPSFPPNVRFRVINHADKEIKRLDMKLEYLDSGGKKLKEWPLASYSATRTASQTGPAIVVAGNAKAEFDSNAPFMPKETKTVAVTLKKVRFVDAEEWKPKAVQKP
jgi:predicted Zn finger-like uncharacterized protein